MLALVYDRDFSSRHYYAYFVKLRSENSSIAPTVERRVDWPHGPGAVMTIDGRFFASVHLATLEVGWDGSITTLFDESTWDMTMYGDELVANRSSGIYRSGNGGETWELVVYVGDGRFFEVDGRLCLIKGATLSVIDLDTSSITTLAWKGLPNTGERFRDAAQFGDRVYIATADGLFYTKVSAFFMPLSTK
jgi:hypothetical protein